MAERESQKRGKLPDRGREGRGEWSQEEEEDEEAEVEKVAKKEEKTVKFEM